jgi:hypothetical protein
MYIYLPPSVTSALIIFNNKSNFAICSQKMVCRNICDRLGCKRTFEYDQYIVGKKYCRRCETYFYYNGSFCPCCGMQLRLSPTSKKVRRGLGKWRLTKERRVLNSVNLQIQPKLAKGVQP